MLKDENFVVRESAAKALGKLKAETAAIEPLITWLKDKEWRVRVSAAEALGQLQAKEAIEPLIAVLEDEAHCNKYFSPRLKLIWYPENATPGEAEMHAKLKCHIAEN